MIRINYHPDLSGWFEGSSIQGVKGESFLYYSRILESSTPRTLAAQKIELKSLPEGEGFSLIPRMRQ